MSQGPDKIALAHVVLVGGAEASGINAREIDGARIVLLQFELRRTGTRLLTMGLLLDDARYLRDHLTTAIDAESTKASNALQTGGES